MFLSSQCVSLRGIFANESSVDARNVKEPRCVKI